MHPQVQGILHDLKNVGYFAEENLALTLFLAEQMKKPLLIEGPAGVGKTELAKAWGRMRGYELIRLQCYEGLDESKALYEWNYQKQLLHIQVGAAAGQEWEKERERIFSEEFLLKRPLLTALTSSDTSILLIDEIDKSDMEFESFLLEALSDWQVTIPELGTVAAVHRPFVVLTSNGSRDISDALRRRCLHYTIGYPEFHREVAMIRSHVSAMDAGMAETVVEVVHNVRRQPLRKPPGITETIDWAEALQLLEIEKITVGNVQGTFSALLKHTQDVEFIVDKLPYLLPKETFSGESKG